MFAQHCKAGLPLGSENFTSWTSRLYRRKCFQIAKGNIYFLFMGGESDPDHLNPLRATILELWLQNTGPNLIFVRRLFIVFDWACQNVPNKLLR